MMGQMRRASFVSAAMLFLAGCAGNPAAPTPLTFPDKDGRVVYEGQGGPYTIMRVHEVTPGNPNWSVRTGSGITLIPRERIIFAGP